MASRSVRDSIKTGKIPPLLVSKADGNEMCLVWYIKGMCNMGACPWEADHVEYVAVEYVPLCQWCNDYYPK